MWTVGVYLENLISARERERERERGGERNREREYLENLIFV